jgi:hypothetical protein
MSRLSHFIRRNKTVIHEVALGITHGATARFSTRRGAALTKRKTPVVVTLTTIPERLDNAPLAIESLLRQKVKPDRIVLWLGKAFETAPLPQLLARQATRGLEIRFVEDVGPHTKIVHALREFSDCLVVSCDDDKFYPANWLEQLLAGHQRHPDCVVCQRSRRMGFDASGALLPYLKWEVVKDLEPSLLAFPECVSGILYPPGLLPPEVFNITAFRKLCPKNDDIWMKAMSFLAGVRCHNVTPFSPLYPTVRGSQKKTLWSVNQLGGNEVQMNAVAEHYDLLRLLPKNGVALSLPVV